jgi:isopenicillin-N N-acyltransferase-like protein
MNRFRRASLLSLSIVLALASGSLAHEPFRYPAGRHGKGELKHIHNIPVLMVEGSPEEMGEQIGVLLLKPASAFLQLQDDFLDKNGWRNVYSLVLKSGNSLLPRFPADCVKELDAAATSSVWPRELLVFANTILDLRRIVQCSALIIEPERSATGGPLFGRNLDWPPVGPLHEYTVVTVYRPAGKRAFASIVYPGLLGCPSGINDAGLAVAMLDSVSSKDGSPAFNALGTPTLLALRRVLEECASVDEAEELLRSIGRASMLNVAICDRQKGAVLEITPKSVVRRPATDGICACTNHFRTAELAESTTCWRYDLLDASRAQPKHTVADVAQRMHAVNQGALTLQTMVFEPAALRLHVAFGEGPATRLPLRTLDLAELFQSE